MTTILRLIGDAHGAYQYYLPLLADVDYTLQVGDLGLNYRPFLNVDPVRNKAIAGNHDCYQRDSVDYFRKQPFFLGDHGTFDFRGATPPIFYVRGAWSIDHAGRQAHAARGGAISWWAEEELATAELDAAIREYARLKPDLVVTHEAPHDILQFIVDPTFAMMFDYPEGIIKTRTSLALQAMLDEHRPKLWCFGHHHKRWESTIEGTRFVCLDMLGRHPSKAAGAILDIEV